jgi:hypothetical protein
MPISSAARLRKSLVSLFILASFVCFFAFTGLASAHSAAPATGTANCVIHTPPPFVESGLGASESSVAGVIIVECRPVFSQDRVTITADELNSRCHNTLSWFSPSSAAGTGQSFDVFLDNDGNANATVWGGPSCAAGKSLICAHLDAPPFTTVCANFTILPPRNTTPGVRAIPSTVVEDSTTSSAQTVVYAEFPSKFAEQLVKISTPELNARCTGGITWVGPDEAPFGTGSSTFVTLDNNGNAFVVALAGPSCASGSSVIEASLTIAPFTTYTTTFKILSPRPTCC